MGIESKKNPIFAAQGFHCRHLLRIERAGYDATASAPAAHETTRSPRKKNLVSYIACKTQQLLTA